MKSSKERKMDRKRKHKELAVSKTEQSRQRRVDNKAKRDEIHAINPELKIKIIDQKTYINNREVEIVDNEIKLTELEKDKAYDAVPIMETYGPRYIERDRSGKIIDSGVHKIEPEIVVVTDESEVNVIEKIETKNRSALQRLTDKLRRK